jgi:release factor glutamine methyltransferase
MSREPLQYILGTAPFCNLMLEVSGNVLVPRPETEELVIALAELLSADPPRKILDLGTGSGACILALGRAFPAATLTACDCDDGALAVARRNAALCQLSNRVEFVRSDWFSQLRGSWDLIISNPPYLTEDEWLSAAPEIKMFEPKIALLGGGPDGTLCAKKILSAAQEFLNPSGLLAIEIGIHQGQVLANFSTKHGLQNISLQKDWSGRDRYLFVRK